MNQLREGCKPKAELSRELLVGLAVGGKQQQGGNQESAGEALLRAGGRGTLWQWLEEVRICCFLNQCNFEEWWTETLLGSSDVGQGHGRNNPSEVWGCRWASSQSSYFHRPQCWALSYISECLQGVLYPYLFPIFIFTVPPLYHH